MKIPKNPINDIPQVRANNTKSRNNLSIGEVLQAYKSKQSDIGEVLQAYRKRESSFGDIFQSQNRHVNGKIAQLATKITHYTNNYTYHPDPTQTTTKTETVGRKMEAYLDLSSPIKGSAPGDDQKPMMSALKTRYGKRLTSSCFVRGHLLNDNLGGFGLKENLFPLTATANDLHKSRVENFVKEYLYSPTATYRKPGLYYKVEVDSQFDDTQTGDKFKCKLQEWNPTTQVKSPTNLVDVEISSDLSRDYGASSGQNTWEFENDNVPDNWFPGRRGAQREREGKRREFTAHQTAGNINVQ